MHLPESIPWQAQNEEVGREVSYDAVALGVVKAASRYLTVVYAS